MRETSGTIRRDEVQTQGTGTAGSLLVAARTALVGIVETLLKWQELSTQRRRLLELDAHMLKDIGISRADAVREAKRPFWDRRAYGVGDGKPASSAERPSAVTLVSCQR